MAIEFDPEKDAVNVKKHGISLAEAEHFIALASIEDNRHAYGEERYRAFGHIDGIAHCLVFTMRGRNVRVISLRRARSKEMKRHVR